MPKIPYNERVLARLHARSKRVDGHLLWQGAISIGGHGQTSFHNGTVLVHRLAMHLLKDFDLNSLLQINHIRECRYANCWDVEHLYTGTHRDNMEDWKVNNIICRNGHELSKDNTYTYLDKNKGAYLRICRECSRERKRRFREKSK